MHCSACAEIGPTEAERKLFRRQFGGNTPALTRASHGAHRTYRTHAAHSTQRAAHSGQRAVGSGQRAAGSGHRASGIGHSVARIVHRAARTARIAHTQHTAGSGHSTTRINREIEGFTTQKITELTRFSLPCTPFPRRRVSSRYQNTRSAIDKPHHTSQPTAKGV